MTNRHAIILFLIVALVFSGWYFVRGLSYEVQIFSGSEKSKQVVPEGVGKKISGKKIDYNSIVEKNIFHPERIYVERPSESGKADEPLVSPLMPNLVLKGIVQRPNGEYVAYITYDGKDPQSVHVGDRVENMKVVSITLTDVTIRWNNTDVNLSLKKIKQMEDKK